MIDKKTLFEKISPTKAILTLAIPTIISQLIDVIYNLADTFFLGRTGNPYMIASTGIAVGLFAIGIVISNLFGIGGGSLIARLMGVSKYDRLKYVASFSFYSSILVSIIYSIFILIFNKPLLFALGASEMTYEYCRQYTSIVVIIGVPIVTTSNTVAHLLRNAGYSFHAGMGLSIGGILNIALDPLFMFVIFPEGQEVYAAAIATFISSVISLIYLGFAFIFTKKKTLLSINPKWFFQATKEEISALFKIGIPSALLVFLFIISQMVTLAVMSNYGDLPVAAIGVIVKVEKLAGAIGLGICQGMLPIGSYNYSSKNYARLKQTLNAGFIIGVIASSTCCLVFLIFSKQIVSLFLTGNNADSATTLEYGDLFLTLRFIVPLFMFLNYYSSYSLQSMNDGKLSFIHAVTRIVVIYIPLVFLFSGLFQETGLALSFVVSELIAGSIGLILVLKRRRSLIQSKESIQLQNSDK